MKKRSFIATIALLLVLALVAPSTSVLAAKKVALNKKKATIQVGQNLTLKLKNNKKKVTWKTSKKAVATVSKKGVVKAKKVGKATITAKAGGKTYKCKITVKKATPVAPKATPLTQLGSAPCVKYIDRYLGYAEINGEERELRLSVPVTITASVGYLSTGTTLGSYVGNAKYNISFTGKLTMPTQAYYYENGKKVNVAVPADMQSRMADIKADLFDKNTVYEVRVRYLKENAGDFKNYLGTVAVTDTDFDGYVSSYTNDGNGNFSYAITDVSVFGQYQYFRIESIDW